MPNYETLSTGERDLSLEEEAELTSEGHFPSGDDDNNDRTPGDDD